jgi:hypothetical protein
MASPRYRYVPPVVSSRTRGSALTQSTRERERVFPVLQKEANANLPTMSMTIKSCASGHWLLDLLKR